MFIDDVAEVMSQGDLRIGYDDGRTNKYVGLPDGILTSIALQRFALSIEIVKLRDDLVLATKQESLNSIVENLFLPAEFMWLEYREIQGDAAGMDCGYIIMMGDSLGKKHDSDDILIVQIIRIFDNISQGLIFSLNRKTKETRINSAPQWLRKAGEAMYDALREHALDIVMSLHIINTPTLVVYETPDRSKLNKARAARGKRPMLTNSIVKINPIHAGITVRTKGQGTGEHVGRALHHVRSFLRFKQGRTEIVRAHWRGSADHGVSLHNYQVE
jgi:hypothetical protein